MKKAKPTRRRARSTDAKLARRATLLDAARHALDDTAYDGIKVEGIAAAAGLAKGTAYVYFNSKEALFLAVLMRELGDWFCALESSLDRLTGDPLVKVPRTLARSLSRRPALIALLGLVHGRLEVNTPLDDIRKFKFFLVESLDRIGPRLDTVLSLGPGSGVALLLRAHALAIGIGQMAGVSDNVREVIDSDRRLSRFKIDFARDFAQALEDTLRGWVSLRAES